MGFPKRGGTPKASILNHFNWIFTEASILDTQMLRSWKTFHGQAWVIANEQNSSASRQAPQG